VVIVVVASRRTDRNPLRADQLRRFGMGRRNLVSWRSQTTPGGTDVTSPDQGPRCPNCSRYAGTDAAFCPHCGAPLRPGLVPARPGGSDDQRLPRAEFVLLERKRSLIHWIFRWLLCIWLVAFPVVSCAPLLIGTGAGGEAGSMAAVAGVVLGGVFLIPWLVGLLVLGLLTLLTR
jgi:hypothetical protein